MNNAPDSSQLSPLKRAYLALEETQARLDRLEAQVTEPIAIIGMACRFPGGADSPKAYWELLRNGEDAISEVPADRWNIDDYYDPDNHAPGKMNTRCGGFLREPVGAFDPQFFGISPREANSMDPQQRLLLEVTWEALENAAIAPDRLAGSRTGVFIGATSFDYAYLFVKKEDHRLLDGYYASGIAHSILSGRISYVLGLNGPSLTVDTACSSSLTALHLAVQSLRSGETSIAVTGGVSLILSPENFIAFTKYGMLDPEGRCKTFDADANGFARGEGCGILILKRLSDAQADGDRILAVIRGSAASQDGASSGLTVPNGPSQENVIRRALENAGVEPVEVGYIEAHGTGTSLGDPIEVRALGNVFTRKELGGQTLWIGSVKTNFGHLEAAAGVASVMKVVLTLQNGAIPQNLHFHTPSPLITWENLPFNVPGQLTPWPEPEGHPRIAGVSSFGFSGTNVHVVLEEAPVSEPVAMEEEKPVRLMAISAKNAKALKALAERYQQELANPKNSLAEACYTANTGRSHLSHRLAIIAGDLEQARNRLDAYLHDQAGANIFSGVLPGGDPPKIAFLFTGQGAQYAGMAKGLYASQPVFRAVLDRCAELLKDQIDRPLLSLIFAENESDAALLNQTTYTQPALFAIEMALVELWKSWGILPGAVLGHSVGAYAAACSAGIFSLEDGLRLIARRGQLMGSLPEGGGMAAVFAPEDQVLPYLASRSDTVSIATYNAPDNTVISGDIDDVKAVLEEMKADGIQSRSLKVSHAFHSSRMDHILGQLEQAAASVRFSSPRITFISDTSGEAAPGGTAARAVYWRRHTREAVRFQRGIESLYEQGYRLFLEIGPSPTLTGLGQRCLAKVDEKITWLTSLKASTGSANTDLQFMYSALAELYTLGHSVKWENLEEGSRRAGRIIQLPNYPFQRDRYWLSAKESAKPSGRAARADAQQHPLIGQPLRTATKNVIFESNLSCTEIDYLNDHRIYGTALLPGAAFMEAAFAAGQSLLGTNRVAVTGMILSDALIVGDQETRTLQMIATPDGDEAYSLQIFSRNEKENEWKTHATARIVPGRPAPKAMSVNEILSRCPSEISAQAHQQRLIERGMAFGPSLLGVESIRRRDGEAIGRILPTTVEEGSLYRLHPALLDAHLQVIAAALPEDAGTYLPFSLARYEIFRPGETPCWSHVWLHPSGSSAKVGETVTANLHFLNEQGDVVAQIVEISLKRTEKNALLRLAQSRLEDWLYEIAWQDAPLPPVAESIRQEAAWIPEMPEAQPSFESDPGILEYGLEVLPVLEQISRQYIVCAFDALGWQPQPGERFSQQTLAERLSIHSRQMDLFGRLLAILAEDGLLERQDDGWIARQAFEPMDPTEQLESLKQAHPNCAAEIRFTERCGRGLAEVLDGRGDPLQLLFPGSDLSDAEALYQKSITAQAYNRLIRTLVTQACAQIPAGRTLRVLEVGAGTGGTTSFVLPSLPEDHVDYLFTDISPLFLARAKEKFAGKTGFRTMLLDLEKEPDEQGLKGETFDLIIAANVIHATSDIRRTVQRLEQKLAPGGLLVMLEVTAPQRWIDLSFGMTEGWWLFSDRELRKDYPLLNRAQWLNLLAEVGFEHAVAYPGDTCPVDEAILVAQRPVQSATVAQPQGGAWIVFNGKDTTGSQLAGQIRASGSRCIQVQPGGKRTAAGDQWQVNPLRLEDYQALLNEAAPCQGIVHLWSLEQPDVETIEGPDHLLKSQEITSGSALALIQALLSGEASPLPPIWLVTRGAEKVNDETGHPLQAGLWGLARTVRLEHPELHCNAIDLSPDDDGAETLWREVRQVSDENQAAWRGGKRYVARLKRSRQAVSTRSEQAVQLTVTRRGSIDNLTYQPMVRRAPGPGEVEIQVQAVGLNFKDVLNTLGMYPGDAGPLGGECAGVVSAVGSDVRGLEVGDAVIALASGAFASYVIAPADMVFPAPSNLTAEEAASLPIPFITAAFTLLHLANLSKGQSVLIHAAAGGVGLAAVELAQRAGAEVFATAGSPEKRAYLQAQGVQHIYDSRSLDFAEAIRSETSERGVDVILNSLAGDFIPASLGVLAQGGCFLEIGKSGILNEAQIAELGEGRRYHVVDWSVEARENPALIRGILLDILRRFDEGELNLLPRRVFGSEEIIPAFRFMAQARHTGKIVVNMATGGSHLSISPHATYLITGGLRGLGLLTAQWLVRHGARHIVLAGRSQPAPKAMESIRQMEEQGVEVVIRAVDVSQHEVLKELVREIRANMPQLRGVFHSAGVLDDHALIQQDWQTFTRVLAPKALGAWNLHDLTRNLPLDYFVMYSSVASVFGSPGQANHSTANAFMDALAFHRQAQGLPAASINWGVWEDVGIAAERNVSSRAALQGLGAISPEDGLSLMEKILESGPAQVVASPIHWPTFLRTFGGGLPQPFLAEMASEHPVETTHRAPAQAAAVPAATRIEKIRGAAPAKQRTLLLDFVRETAARVLSLNDEQAIPDQKPLNEMGLDSLMAVELRNLLDEGLAMKQTLPATLIFNYPTTAAITDYLSREVLAAVQPTETESKPPAPPAEEANAESQASAGLVNMLDNLEELSDEEVNRILAAKMKGKSNE